jgi:hypothetical protein
MDKYVVSIELREVLYYVTFSSTCSLFFIFFAFLICTGQSSK